MQVLLNENVSKLGLRGEVVSVKPGYFRNFLFPKGMAVIVTPSVLKRLEEQNRILALKKEETLENAKKIADKLDGLKISLKAKATKTGKLYGAIKPSVILGEIAKAVGFEFDKDFLEFSPIKELGEHKVKINLGEEFIKEITVVIETE